jgi:uncharacterized protein (TIGR02246 family)
LLSNVLEILDENVLFRAKLNSVRGETFCLQHQAQADFDYRYRIRFAFGDRRYRSRLTQNRTLAPGLNRDLQIMRREGKGFWYQVQWDGKTASIVALEEPDEREAHKKLLAGLKTANKVDQMHAADPKTEQEIRAFIRAFEESFNANDASALAALCTEDAIQIGPEGPICGRQAIEKKYADFFRQSRPANMTCTIDQVSVLGNVSWNSGTWSCTVQGENGLVQASGYRLDVLVREGDAWKECISCYNVTPESTVPK